MEIGKWGIKRDSYKTPQHSMVFHLKHVIYLLFTNIGLIINYPKPND